MIWQYFAKHKRSPQFINFASIPFWTISLLLAAVNKKLIEAFQKERKAYVVSSSFLQVSIIILVSVLKT